MNVWQGINIYDMNEWQGINIYNMNEWQGINIYEVNEWQNKNIYDMNEWQGVLTAAISSRGSSQLLRESEHETCSTTFSC